MPTTTTVKTQGTIAKDEERTEEEACRCCMQVHSELSVETDKPMKNQPATDLLCNAYTWGDEEAQRGRSAGGVGTN